MDKNKDQENVVSSSSEKTEPEAVVQPPQLQGTNDDDATPDTTQEDETPPAEKPAPPPTAAVSAPEPPRIKHDWYQTHTDVVVNVMIKKLRREDVRVEFGERRLEVDIDLGEGRSHSLVFALAHPVVKEKCSFKILTTKVEIKLRKSEGLQWAKLEGPEVSPNNPQPQMGSVGKDAAANVTHKYPSSSHHTRDWDKLVAQMKADEKNEKLEGDAALNQLFQSVYKDGNEETRRAMNKSFVESGGTVLSTNWREVGDKEVERKPPDGMEWKKYEV